MKMFEESKHAVAYDKEVKEIADYYITPKQFLDERFQQLWDQATQDKIQLLKQKYSEWIQDDLASAASCFKDLFNLLQLHKCNDTSLFYFQFNDSLDKREEQDLSKSIVNEPYLKDYASICASVHNRSMNINSNANLPTKKDLRNFISDACIESITETLERERISNLQKFIQILSDLIAKEANKPQTINDEDIIQQCDVWHLQIQQMADRVHECQNGHQLQCFGGTKDYLNRAVTKSCNELNDKHEITLDNQVVKWPIVQKKLLLEKRWIFQKLTSSQIAHVKEKNDKIWNHFGKLICEVYTKKYFKPMQFETSEKMVLQKNIHYILILGRSGSMRHGGWYDLILCQALFDTLSSNPQTKKYSRVSVIGHDWDSEITFETKVPDPYLTNQIEFTGGGNRFSECFQDAYNLIENNLNQFDKHVMCFMTDGEGDYPWSQIQMFQSNSTLMKKPELTCIMYGTDYKRGGQNIRRIASSLKGKVKKTLHAHELKQEFIRLIPCFYEY